MDQKITKDFCRVFRITFDCWQEELCQRIEEETGMKIKLEIGNISFSENEFRTTMKAITPSAKASKENYEKERNTYDVYQPMFDLPKIDTCFTHKNSKYQIIGMTPRKKILLKKDNNKIHTATIKAVKDFLGMGH